MSNDNVIQFPSKKDSIAVVHGVYDPESGVCGLSILGERDDVLRLFRLLAVKVADYGEEK